MRFSQPCNGVFVRLIIIQQKDYCIRLCACALKSDQLGGGQDPKELMGKMVLVYVHTNAVVTSCIHASVKGINIKKHTSIG